MILSLQYYSLHRKDNDTAQDWMGGICIKAAECNYTQHDRQFNDQFINGTNNEVTMQEIIKELKAQRNMTEIDSAQVLMWAKRVEVQRVLKKALHRIKNVRL